MLPGKESLYPADWLKKADVDFKRVPRRLREGDMEDAAFHLQQALEKGLKAFLLSKGWALKKIHNLQALLDDAIGYDSSLETFRSITVEVTGFYIIDRYPIDHESISREDARRVYEAAKPLMQFVRKAIKSKSKSKART